MSSRKSPNTRLCLRDCALTGGSWDALHNCKVGELPPVKPEVLVPIVSEEPRRLRSLPNLSRTILPPRVDPVEPEEKPEDFFFILKIHYEDPLSPSPSAR